jgi:hypothetical protein
VAGGGSNLHSPEKVAAGRRIEGEPEREGRPAASRHGVAPEAAAGGRGENSWRGGDGRRNRSAAAGRLEERTR